MFDRLPALPDCRPIALAISILCGSAAAAGDPVDGAPATAAPHPPTGAVSRVADLQGAGSLSQLIATVGRAPDQSEDGGACGGIVVHDWYGENLRVISLGNQVQMIAPLDPEADPR